ncbi:MAG TPA: DNA alkylation repair protein [Sphingorhabdus sp.]|jgi:3-methyladenine DNA glycosylase AlkD|uniref:DNA alkylation repair protein n=1 Tax=Sphingorhabdus sp. TaxID=1902408 RepID=UPI002C6104CA|nr:DNA alkylation repair protein [Sphingorhabdus sp.]HMT41763.1 DNA alkylation repair protein [Sphingorhabdus sp.]HMU22361.1 DNA alkylation repair protein [Sphingorhabdus sp.]
MSLAAELRARLLEKADRARAPAMQAYMKSAMPYMGVASADIRRTARAVSAGLEYSTADDWRADILAIWRGAHYREEYYAAIELAGMRYARPFQRMDALPMYREMIESGGWWDIIDAIAPHRLWDILEAERDAMRETMLLWAKDDNMWVRRSAILCQLHAKAKMDLELLYACFEPSITSKEFFLRKAIGWVLRQYARTDPDEVRRYVTTNEERLSPLSKREALKHL